MLIRGTYESKIDNDEFRDAFENGSLAGHLDIKRLREGQSGGAFWSVWAPCPKNDTDFSNDNYLESKETIELLSSLDLCSQLKQASSSL